jgi:hypothetical protein
MVDWAAKWAGYAAAHEKFRADSSYVQDDNDLVNLGWQEIKVCDDPTDLESLFTPELTSMICNFFQSEFAVVFRGVMERGPGDVDESAFWHLDQGPEAHLRILAPLTENDGGTAVISLEDAKNIDYDPADVRDRLWDISHLGEHTAWLVSPPVGEALICQPTRILHKAVSPSSGVRRVFQLGLIPWGEPWQAFEAEHGEGLMGNANSFPMYEFI